MKTMKNLAIAIVCGALAACATKPQNIPPTSISPIQFKDLSCEELRLELRFATEQRDAFIRRQKGNRTRDTLLNALVLPGLGAATSDHEVEVANSKGTVIALEREIAKRCVD